MCLIEIKRVINNRKGWLWIIVLLIIELAIIMEANSFRINNNIEKNKESYILYLKKYGGEVSDKKYEELALEISEIEEKIDNADGAYGRYMAGEISKAEMQALQSNLASDYDDYEVLKSIQHQYDYALSKDESYVIYENGWIILLGAQCMHWGLPIVLGIIIMPLFVMDYSHNMHMLTNTCKNKGKKIYCSRVLASIIISLILCVLIGIIDYVFVDIRYGLDSNNIAITNIEIFSDAEVQFSLMTNYLLVILQNFIGCIYVIFIISLIGVCIKDYFYGLVLYLSFYIIPTIILEREQWVKFCLPQSFFADGGYINGFEILDDARYIIETNEFIQKMVIVFVAIVFLGVISIKIMKKKLNVLPFLMICMILTGCNSNKQESDTIINVSDYGNVILEAEDAIVIDEEGEYFVYIGENKIPLNDNPLHNEDCFITRVVTDGKNIYYQICDEINGVPKIKFYEMNPKTYKRKIIYEKPLSVYLNSSYLDIEKRVAIINDNSYANCILMLASEKYIIYTNNEDTVLVNRDNNRETTILKKVKNFSLHNEIIYYTNAVNCLCKYNINTKKSENVCNEYIKKYYIQGDTVIYIDGLDLCIKKYDILKDEIEVLVEAETESFSVYGNLLIYLDYSGQLIMYDMDNDEEIAVDNNVWIYSVLSYRKQVMYITKDGSYKCFEMKR